MKNRNMSLLIRLINYFNYVFITFAILELEKIMTFELPEKNIS